MVMLDQVIRQSEFGEIVGISQQAVSDLVMRGVLSSGATAAQWLREYCGNLREQAAGRATSGDLDLATERAGLAKAQRERIEMQNAVTRGELAPRALLAEVLSNTAPKVCSLLESIVPALKRRSGYKAEDLAYVDGVIAQAQNAIAEISLDAVVGVEDINSDDTEIRDES